MQAAIQLYHRGRQTVFYFLRYRLHLSLIFAFLLYYNNLRTGTPINSSFIVSFTLWHFALFLFDRIYDRQLDQLSQPDEFIPDSQAKVLYGVVGLCLLVSLIFWFKSGAAFYYWLFLLPVTFLYTVPVFKGLRAKNIFLLKNFYSAVLIYGLPLALHSFLLNNNQLHSINYSPIVSLMIYVLIGEIFWDIRDCSVDKANNIATLPNVLGLWPTKLIMLGLILTDVVKSGYHISESGIIYILLLSFTKENTDRLIFHLPPLIALLRFCL
jgi:hypothetical protein